VDKRDGLIFTSEPQLIFVYNANAGLARGLWDALHKLVSPDSYPCSLCALTYGALTMRAEWKAALKQLPLQSTFLHKDEFRARWPKLDCTLPAVLVVAQDRAIVVLDGPALDRLLDISGLTVAITGKLKTLHGLA
jgi:hypothetical protein